MNKKTFYRIIVFSWTIFFIWWIFNYSSKQKITNYPAYTKQNIVAFGASITAGRGAENSGGFVKLLENRLYKELGYKIINKGVSGNTTADGLNRIDEILELNPKIVILSLGGNDFLQRIPLEITEKNLNKIIKKIHQNGSMIILLGIRGGIFRDGASAMFKMISLENKTAYVPDILDGIIFKKSLMSDAVHPNDEGHKKIAEKIYPVLKKLLK